MTTENIDVKINTVCKPQKWKTVRIDIDTYNRIRDMSDREVRSVPKQIKHIVDGLEKNDEHKPTA